MTNTTTPVLIFLAPISFCYNYSFLYDLLFTHPVAITGVVVKILFEFLEYSSVSISKKAFILESLIKEVF